MTTTQDGGIDRRSFLRRSAGITAGAAALIGGGLHTPAALAAPTSSLAAAIAPLTGLSVVLWDVTGAASVARFTSCTNIGSENEIIVTRTTDGSVRKTPGALRTFTVTLTGGVGNDAYIVTWRQLVETGQITKARQAMRIIVYDSLGYRLCQWSLTAAWPAELVARSDGQSLIESLTLVCDRLVRDA